jgi:hypothetical protein
LKFQYLDLGSIWISGFQIYSRKAGKLEAAIGFEPMNEGFADLCLSHLATPPCICCALIKCEDAGFGLQGV